MNFAQRFQSWMFFSAVTSLLVLTSADYQISFQWQVVLLATLVALLGLPHGAVDPLVAQRANLWHDLRGLTAFLVVYILIAILTLALWISFPGASLAVFLAISAWHFGNDWRENVSSTGLRAGLGLSVVSLPALTHSHEMQVIFAMLANPGAAEFITRALMVMAPVGMIAVLFGAAKIFRISPWVSCELIILAAGALLLPPLLFFITYFCFLHSPRHLIHVARGLGPKTIAAAASVFTLITVVGAIIAFSFMAPATLEDQIIRTVFVGLAILTVPHMLLIEFASRRDEV